MPLEHNFKRFPELTNSQMQEFYFDSPHKQITEDFRARVVKVTDGDTVRVEWEERNFTFPIRLANLAAAEINEPGGPESQRWLSGKILGREVEIIPTKTRVEKWGRLLADIVLSGENMTESSIIEGFGVDFAQRKEGLIPNFGRELDGITLDL